LKKRKKKEKKSWLELGKVVAATNYECVARKKKGLRLSFQAFKGHFTIWKVQNLLIGR
jgi:hypothetical protein